MHNCGENSFGVWENERMKFIFCLRKIEMKELKNEILKELWIKFFQN